MFGQPELDLLKLNVSLDALFNFLVALHYMSPDGNESLRSCQLATQSVLILD